MNVAAGDEGVAGGLDREGEEVWVRGLLGDCGFEEPVAQDAKGEDCCGEAVAGGDGTATKEVCEDLVVVFCPSWSVMVP